MVWAAFCTLPAWRRSCCLHRSLLTPALPVTPRLPQPLNPPNHPPPADRFTGDAAAIERICRAPRYAIRSAGKAAAGAVPLLVASLPQRFEASRQPCFLYVASELIKTFGDEPARDLDLGALAYLPTCCCLPALWLFGGAAACLRV